MTSTIKPPTETTPHSQANTHRIVLADTGFSFQPIWDVRQQRIFAYRCCPLWENMGGHAVVGTSVNLAGIETERALALNGTVMGSAAKFVQKALDNFTSVNVIVPIFLNRNLNFAFIEDLQKSLARNFWPIIDNVYLEIQPNLRSESDRPSIGSLLEALNGYGSGVFVRVPSPDIDFGFLARGSVSSVGLDTGGRPVVLDVLEKLGRFAVEARASGLLCHIMGLSEIAETVACVDAGFDLVGSEAIAPAFDPAVDASDGVEAADILKSALRRAGTGGGFTG